MLASVAWPVAAPAAAAHGSLAPRAACFQNSPTASARSSSATSAATKAAAAALPSLLTRCRRDARALSCRRLFSTRSSCDLALRARRSAAKSSMERPSAHMAHECKRRLVCRVPRKDKQTHGRRSVLGPTRFWQAGGGRGAGAGGVPAGGQAMGHVGNLRAVPGAHARQNACQGSERVACLWMRVLAAASAVKRRKHGARGQPRNCTCSILRHRPVCLR